MFLEQAGEIILEDRHPLENRVALLPVHRLTEEDVRRCAFPGQAARRTVRHEQEERDHQEEHPDGDERTGESLRRVGLPVERDQLFICGEGQPGAG